MTTSVIRKHRAYVPNSALADTIEFSADEMVVHLTDGRSVSVPLTWFPVLFTAEPRQRANYRILAGGRGIHWPDLDEDLSVAGLLAGSDGQSA
jgi:hypothetical protein